MKELRVGQSYKLSLLLNCILANILLTKWSCANKFYVLIGSTICQLSMWLFILESYLYRFFGTVSQSVKPRKVNCVEAIGKDNYKINVIFGVWTSHCNRHHTMINTVVYCCRSHFDSIMFVCLTCTQLICVILEWRPPCFTSWQRTLFIKYCKTRNECEAKSLASLASLGKTLGFFCFRVISSTNV